MRKNKEQQLHPIATKTVGYHAELYKVVDFLNKTLKEYRLMFGLYQNSEDNTMTITVYKI
ncbi:YpmA family protein [Calderihabitans maritimus]|uniref:DUF4264 domain-containing protein n=1 Tax=Calderihabitans maritimus TaxID=1246530 RepID=A0A1Z5HXJ5_9FIRM|nr:hypothetical protein TherJR_1930 [Calderihabitans maritimus]